MINSFFLSLSCGVGIGFMYALLFWRGHKQSSTFGIINSFISRYLLVFVVFGWLWKVYHVNIMVSVCAFLITFWGSIIIKAGLRL